MLEAFVTLKEKLTSAPIIINPNWSLPFKIMCDISDYAIVEVLDRKKNRQLHVIFYASKVLKEAQLNYATMKKKMLTIAFAYDKFLSYLIGSKSIIYTYHSTIKYLLEKKEFEL